MTIRRSSFDESAPRGDPDGNAGATKSTPLFRRVEVGAILLAVLYVAWNLWAFLPYCRNPALIDDDHRQHLLPFYAARYPEHFQDRLLVDYARAYLPIGYRALVAGAARFVDPVAFSKGLGIALLFLTAMFAFLAGRQLAGPVAGAITAVLALHSQFIIETTFSGLFRGFGFPLLFLFVWLWSARRLRMLLATLLLQSAFYPPVFLLCWPAFLVDFLPPTLSRLKARRRFIGAFLIVSLLSFSGILLLSRKPAEYGDIVRLEQAKAMPEWQKARGRFEELPWDPTGRQIRKSLRLGLHANPRGVRLCKTLVEWNDDRGDPFFWWFLLPLVPFALCAARRYRWALALPLSGLALFLAAQAVAFSLGWPDRFSTYSFCATTVLLPACALAGVRRARRAVKLPFYALLTLLLALSALFYPAGGAGAHGRVRNAKALQPLCDYLRQLEGPVLLAGWPNNVLDDIPLFAHKEVLVNYEHAQPLYLGFYATISERIHDNLALIFAIDLETVLRIRDKYGLTHLVIGERILAQRGPTPNIFAPFNDQASTMRRRVPSESFVFHNAPDDRQVYRDAHFIVFDLRAM